ncbi:MAG TPA: hypothetical protein VK462_09765 [Nitrososphaeraceae archaeon]|nr:hypothetical protein [Nitrososphaeraceae archaeon]
MTHSSFGIIGLLHDVQIGSWSGFDIETSMKVTGFIPCLELGVILTEQFVIVI